MMTATQRIFRLFGGVRPLARALSALGGRTYAPTTVQGWLSRGRIPAARQGDVLAAARALKLALGPGDFFDLSGKGGTPEGVTGGAAPARVEVLSCAEMGEADRRAIAAGSSGDRLMEAAGEGAARLIMERFTRRAVTILCGPGNNGGDGFVIARHLDRAGWPVRVAALVPVARLSGDAGLNARRWIKRKGEAAVEALTPGVIDGAGLVVDALFGAGLARPLDGIAREVVTALATCAIPVVAIDVPSGLDADSGRIAGDGADAVAVQAAVTVTFFRKKPGHLLYPGRAFCGETQVIDIGIAPAVLRDIRPATFENLPELWRAAFPMPGPDAHKYRRGHAVIVGGGEMTGAARLAARACARIGAGLVTIAAPPQAIPLYAADRAGQLTVPLRAGDDLATYLADPRRRAVLVGPGLGVGRETRNFAGTALRLGKAVCLDADALTSFADWPRGLFDLIQVTQSARGPGIVLTPHEGEFRRLFPDIPEGSRLVRAREAARRSGAIVLFKGADTVIAAPDGRAAINGNAPPWLATGGSGDVLAGMITGLLVQGVPPFEAAAMAAWMHGEAAKNFGPGLVADDLPEQIPAVLRALLASGAPLGKL